MENTVVKTWTIVLQAVGCLPVAAYPAVLIASLMGLAGHSPQTVRPVERTLSQGFYLGTILYPVVPLVCSLLAWKAFHQGQYSRCVWLSTFPLLVLGLLTGLFQLMLLMEKKRG